MLYTPNQSVGISFLQPNHTTQKLIFQNAFNGMEVYLTREVEHVDEIYKQLKDKGVSIVIAIRDQLLGDQHLAMEDPNGVGIDIVYIYRI